MAYFRTISPDKNRYKRRVSSGSGIFAENPGCNPPPLSCASPRRPFQLGLRSSLAPFRFCKWLPWLTPDLLRACTVPRVMIATTTPAYPGASHRSFGTQSGTGFHLTLDTAIRQALTVSKASVYTAGRWLGFAVTLDSGRTVVFINLTYLNSKVSAK